MILAIDTETQGLPEWGKPSDDPSQPHLVQLAMVLLDDDLNEQASASLIIKPDGWKISDEVAAIHGITNEKATRLGVSEKVATDLYVNMLYGTGATPLAFNAKFDIRIMRIAMLRAGYDKDWQETNQPPEPFCPMIAATPICNMPPTEKMLARGFTKPKPPKLSEAYKFFFAEDLVGAHDAMIDVRACIRVHRHLLSLTGSAIGDVV